MADPRPQDPKDRQTSDSPARQSGWQEQKDATQDNKGEKIPNGEQKERVPFSEPTLPERTWDRPLSAALHHLTGCSPFSELTLHDISESFARC
jgi:hypothetical protein